MKSIIEIYSRCRCKNYLHIQNPLLGNCFVYYSLTVMFLILQKKIFSPKGRRVKKIIVFLIIFVKNQKIAIFDAFHKLKKFFAA